MWRFIHSISVPLFTLAALIFIAGALADAKDFSSSATLKLSIMPQTFADIYGAKCLDGSPPYRYDLVQDPTRWVLFFEGGGWCFTASDCAARAQGGGGSSRYAGPTAFVGGLLSPDPSVNPRFHNYSLVFLKYCDGTSHTSFREQPVNITKEWREHENIEQGVDGLLQHSLPQQIWMRGRAVLQAQIVDLLINAGMKNAKEIIISGGSAGATTVYLGLDYMSALVKAYAPQARVVGAPDAGFFLDVQSVITGDYMYRNSFIAADMQLWNGTYSGNLNTDCLSAFPSEPWRCYLAQHAAPFIITPFFISNAAYDAYQTPYIMQLQCTPNAAVGGFPQCNATQMVDFVQYRARQIDAMRATLASHPYTGAVVISCFVHEINVDYCSGQALPNCLGWNAYTVSAPGYPPDLSANDIFSAWYSGILDNWDKVIVARLSAHTALLKLAESSNGKDILSQLGNAWHAYSGPMNTEGAPLGVEQIIDPLDFPNNPSCPFPRK